MSLLMTAKTAGVNSNDHLTDVLLRISTCADVRQFTPHDWKEKHEAEVTDRRRALLEQLVAARWLPPVNTGVSKRLQLSGT